MELELKHLAPYLPYGLNVKMQHINGKIRKIIFRDSSKIHIEVDSGVVLCLANILDIKPILIPLSELATNVRMLDNLYDNCKDIDENLDYICEFDGNLTYTSLSFRCVNLLIENHYDVFGLIPEGLAIDIDTLK